MDDSTQNPETETSTIPAPPDLDALLQNSTDATRGEPIVVRAMKRKAELEALLTALPAEDTRARADIEHVLGSFESLLTGDLKALSSMTASDLSRLLELNKHLAETTPHAASDTAPDTAPETTTDTTPEATTDDAPFLAPAS